jgi:FADH2-dependent halogenase
VDSPIYDAIVIGCGPGGSSASTFLARAGKKVLVLEKEIFPRFHIGESLLPCNMTIFRDMGVLPKLKEAGFLPKYGAQFELGNATLGARFAFRDGIFSKESESFQVERAKFDHVLLLHARESGADVREGWTVTKTTNNAEGVTVEARGPDGTQHTFRGQYLIDCSGRGNLTGNQENLREVHPTWKKLAVFAQFENVVRDSGDQYTDIIIARLENKWFWIIPLDEKKTSVGLVIDKDEFTKSPGTPQEIFQRWADSAFAVKNRMKDARQIIDFQTTTDFSYYNRTFVGERLLRVGDAAGFMDPIFSAGVYLAMWSGRRAAETVEKCLALGKPDKKLFADYHKRVFHGIHFYWHVVESYYTTPFMEIFLRPHNHCELGSAIIAILAGEVEGSWALRWRLKYFWLIVAIQKYFPIVPRLSFTKGVPRKVRRYELTKRA